MFKSLGSLPWSPRVLNDCLGRVRVQICVFTGEGVLSLQMEARQRASKQLQTGWLTPPPTVTHTSPWDLLALRNHGYNGGMGLRAPSKTTC